MLSQADADGYIAECKRFATQTAIPIPPGVKNVYELAGAESGSPYLLDVYRGTLKLSRVTFQNRVRTAVQLVRVDVNGAPHTNPDQQRVDGTHIHVYREGYEDKWAEPLNPSVFSDTSDIAQVLQDFCAFCNIDHSQISAQVGML